MELLLDKKASESTDDVDSLFILDLLTNHHIDDFLIGFFHTDAAQTADVADGIFDAFEDEPVAAVELLAVAVHFESQNAGIDSG